MENTQSIEPLSPRQQALVDLVWSYMRRDSEHRDRVQTSYGTKTQLGLARSLERIFEEHAAQGSNQGKQAEVSNG